MGVRCAAETVAVFVRLERRGRRTASERHPAMHSKPKKRAVIPEKRSSAVVAFPQEYDESRHFPRAWLTAGIDPQQPFVAAGAFGRGCSQRDIQRAGRRCCAHGDRRAQRRHERHRWPTVADWPSARSPGSGGIAASPRTSRTLPGSLRPWLPSPSSSSSPGRKL
jgi:hypothetical protein